ncbi:hypothetical protein BGZ89_009470 [Linnemannia elongata]|nr:hypothetical protein BGZ89_009470 [Linnemannia elongata]
MATYKQRAPVVRHAHIEDDKEVDPIHIPHHRHLYHNHVSSAAIPVHGQLSSARHGRSSSPSNCNDSFPATTSFFDASIPTSSQEWASVGNSSSSSRRKSRERLQQQYHEGQQQLRAQEWHFVLNEQPSRRRQLQQQQQRRQQENQRSTPLSINLNGGATVSTTTVDGEEKEVEGATTPPPALSVPIMFLSDDTASSLDFTLSDLTSIEDLTEDARSLWSQDDEMDSSSVSYYSPSPYYNVAGFAPFDFPSSPFMTATTTTTPSISYNSTPPPAPAHTHARRRLPSSTSGTLLIRSTTTPYSSSNSLNQLLFHPTIPQPQQPQQLQGSSSSSPTPLFGREWSRFQTHHQSQMPFHDGSGNFAFSPPFPLSPRLSTHTTTGTVPGSESGSDLDLELDPLHHFPRHHVYRNKYQHQQHHIWGPKPLVYQYQDDSSSPSPKSEVSKKLTMMTLKERRQRQLRLDSSHNSLRSASPSHLTASTSSRRGEMPKSRLREDIITYDDSEAEDMQTIEEMNALVVDIPETMGWLQVFEHALSTFRTSFEVELDSSDSETIKAWARWDQDRTEGTDHQITVTGRTARRGSSFADRRHSPISQPSSQSQSSLLTPIERERIKVVKRQMSASSLDALKRLQTQQAQRNHYNCYYRHQQHPPQIQDAYEDEEQSNPTTTLLAAALSALRRFRDHVKSNLMDPALDEELVSDLSRLGFAGDLGMVVAECNPNGGRERLPPALGLLGSAD